MLVNGKVEDQYGRPMEMLSRIVTNEKNWYEILVHYIANGSSAPASYWHPSEWDEERLLNWVEIFEYPDGIVDKKTEICYYVPLDMAEKIFTIYEDMVYENQLDYFDYSKGTIWE
jgi:hypothetical protein